MFSRSLGTRMRSFDQAAIQAHVRGSSADWTNCRRSELLSRKALPKSKYDRIASEWSCSFGSMAGGVPGGWERARGVRHCTWWLPLPSLTARSKQAQNTPGDGA